MMGIGRQNELDAENARLRALNAELLAALGTVVSHERSIVGAFNALGEPSPAAFSRACEQARATISKAQS